MVRLLNLNVSTESVDGWERRRTVRTRANELVWRERLGDVVVGAQLETENAVGLLDSGSQHDDLDLVRADPTQDVETGETWQHDVEHDEIGTKAGQGIGDHIPTIQFVHDVAVSIEVLHDDLAHGWFVIDDQDPCRVSLFTGHHHTDAAVMWEWQPLRVSEMFRFSNRPCQIRSP